MNTKCVSGLLETMTCCSVDNEYDRMRVVIILLPYTPKARLRTIKQLHTKCSRKE
jgi:hypothetical protein